MHLRGAWAGWWMIFLVIQVAACTRSYPEATVPSSPEALPLQPAARDVPTAIPPSMRVCYGCHQDVVEAYLEHGMARSIGPVGTPEPGMVMNPISGHRYEIYPNDGEAWLSGTTPEGGNRYQRLVGRIGAGLFDTSWIGAEVDPFTQEDTGRLFFAPVETVTGHGLTLSPFELHAPSAGCVDCHVRRSQPFDLPHLRTADHYIRRRIPLPVDTLSHRPFADPDGALRVFDDGRLAERLRTPAGQRWNDGVVAMGLVTMGRLEEATSLFAAFPAPGTAAAVQPSAPDGLVSLETAPAFHHTRGIALRGTGQAGEALAAFSDALTLDPSYAGARMERARLRLRTGDLQGALEDTRLVVEAHPAAEKPWNLNATIALQAGRVGMAVSALETSTRHWPSDAEAWQQLAVLYSRLGQGEKAAQALQRAWALGGPGRE